MFEITYSLYQACLKHLNILLCRLILSHETRKVLTILHLLMLLLLGRQIILKGGRYMLA